MFFSLEGEDGNTHKEGSSSGSNNNTSNNTSSNKTDHIPPAFRASLNSSHGSRNFSESNRSLASITSPSPPKSSRSATQASRQPSSERSLQPPISERSLQVNQLEQIVATNSYSSSSSIGNYSNNASHNNNESNTASSSNAHTKQSASETPSSLSSFWTLSSPTIVRTDSSWKKSRSSMQDANIPPAFKSTRHKQRSASDSNLVFQDAALQPKHVSPRKDSVGRVKDDSPPKNIPPLISKSASSSPPKTNSKPKAGKASEPSPSYTRSRASSMSSLPPKKKGSSKKKKSISTAEQDTLPPESAPPLESAPSSSSQRTSSIVPKKYTSSHPKSKSIQITEGDTTMSESALSSSPSQRMASSMSSLLPKKKSSLVHHRSKSISEETASATTEEDAKQNSDPSTATPSKKKTSSAKKKKSLLSASSHRKRPPSQTTAAPTKSQSITAIYEMQLESQKTKEVKPPPDRSKRKSSIIKQRNLFDTGDIPSMFQHGDDDDDDDHGRVLEKPLKDSNNSIHNFRHGLSGFRTKSASKLVGVAPPPPQPKPSTPKSKAKAVGKKTSTKVAPKKLTFMVEKEATKKERNLDKFAFSKKKTIASSKILPAFSKSTTRTSSKTVQKKKVPDEDMGKIRADNDNTNVPEKGKNADSAAENDKNGNTDDNEDNDDHEDHDDNDYHKSDTVVATAPKPKIRIVKSIRDRWPPVAPKHVAQPNGGTGGRVPGKRNSHNDASGVETPRMKLTGSSANMLSPISVRARRSMFNNPTVNQGDDINPQNDKTRRRSSLTHGKKSERRSSLSKPVSHSPTPTLDSNLQLSGQDPVANVASTAITDSIDDDAPTTPQHLRPSYKVRYMGPRKPTTPWSSTSPRGYFSSHRRLRRWENKSVDNSSHLKNQDGNPTTMPSTLLLKWDSNADEQPDEDKKLPRTSSEPNMNNNSRRGSRVQIPSIWLTRSTAPDIIIENRKWRVKRVWEENEVVVDSSEPIYEVAERDLKPTIRNLFGVPDNVKIDMPMNELRKKNDTQNDTEHSKSQLSSTDVSSDLEHDVGKLPRKLSLQKHPLDESDVIKAGKYWKIQKIFDVDGQIEDVEEEVSMAGSGLMDIVENDDHRPNYNDTEPDASSVGNGIPKEISLTLGNMDDDDDDSSLEAPGDDNLDDDWIDSQLHVREIDSCASDLSKQSKESATQLTNISHDGGDTAISDITGANSRHVKPFRFLTPGIHPDREKASLRRFQLLKKTRLSRLADVGEDDIDNSEHIESNENPVVTPSEPSKSTRGHHYRSRAGTDLGDDEINDSTHMAADLLSEHDRKSRRRHRVLKSNRVENLTDLGEDEIEDSAHVPGSSEHPHEAYTSSNDEDRLSSRNYRPSRGTKLARTKMEEENSLDPRTSSDIPDESMRSISVGASNKVRQNMTDKNMQRNGDGSLSRSIATKEQDDISESIRSEDGRNGLRLSGFTSKGGDSLSTGFGSLSARIGKGPQPDASWSTSYGRSIEISTNSLLDDSGSFKQPLDGSMGNEIQSPASIDKPKLEAVEAGTSDKDAGRRTSHAKPSKLNTIGGKEKQSENISVLQEANSAKATAASKPPLEAAIHIERKKEKREKYRAGIIGTNLLGEHDTDEVDETGVDASKLKKYRPVTLGGPIEQTPTKKKSVNYNKAGQWASPFDIAPTETSGSGKKAKKSKKAAKKSEKDMNEGDDKFVVHGFLNVYK